jgi:hypothetical protein
MLGLNTSLNSFILELCATKIGEGLDPRLKRPSWYEVGLLRSLAGMFI